MLVEGVAVVEDPCYCLAWGCGTRISTCGKSRSRRGWRVFLFLLKVRWRTASAGSFTSPSPWRILRGWHHLYYFSAEVGINYVNILYMFPPPTETSRPTVTSTLTQPLHYCWFGWTRFGFGSVISGPDWIGSSWIELIFSNRVKVDWVIFWPS